MQASWQDERRLFKNPNRKEHTVSNRWPNAGRALSTLLGYCIDFVKT